MVGKTIENMIEKNGVYGMYVVYVQNPIVDTAQYLSTSNVPFNHELQKTHRRYTTTGSKGEMYILDHIGSLNRNKLNIGVGYCVNQEKNELKKSLVNLINHAGAVIVDTELGTELLKNLQGGIKNTLTNLVNFYIEKKS